MIFIKKIIVSFLIVLLLISLIPISASAFGGYFVVKGLNGYHSALCENLSGYSIEQVTWYETLEKVQRTGLSAAPCCKDTGFDYEDDEASMWISSNNKIKNIFEIERMWGILDGYDVGVEDGYDEGYDEGLNTGYSNGYSDGYKKGSDDTAEELTYRINSLELYLYSGALFIAILICILWAFFQNRSNKEFQKLEHERKEFEKHVSVIKTKIEQETLDLQKQKQDTLQSISENEQAAFHRIKTNEQISLQRINVQRSSLEHDIDRFQKTIMQTKQDNPALASQIADAQYHLDIGVFNRMVHKSKPALKAAEEVKKIANEKRELIKQNRQLQYQLDFYEKLFPWLEEFKEIPSDEAISYATGSYSSEYDAVKNWLSPEEYEKLNTAKKYQLALDRWKNRKKSDWDVGIEYERYIGYRLECEGYKVRYIGATLGLKDMGRDLIATKAEKTLIIQCKRWAKEKTIHEKHLFQLYGSTAVYATEHPDSKCKAVFITTTALSDIAKKCADYCSISVIENCPMGEYPLIKCNINKDGDKIYHLPFDQQYDRVIISKNKQSCYAWTTYEAEKLGFRRAYRWHPNKS